MIDAELLRMLCCPETKQSLTLAEAGLVERLNQQLSAGQLRNRAGHAVKEPLEHGLVRADGQFLYPIRRDIPVMLIDEAIPLSP
jgi:uncharacterized protein YbaR (Trm112 family)